MDILNAPSARIHTTSRLKIKLGAAIYLANFGLDEQVIYGSISEVVDG